MNIISYLAWPVALIGIGLALIGADDPVANRMRVSEALIPMMGIKEEVNNEGCHPGSRPSPSPKIAALEVSDAGAGRCTITATLGQFNNKAAVLNGGKLHWTRMEDGQWNCSSSNLPGKYLPAECRLHRLQRR
jgi:hypothetical protein